MTFTAEFFGAVGISVFTALVFLIVAAWREDRRKRLDSPRSESAAVQNISLPREWDPVAELFEGKGWRGLFQNEGRDRDRG